MLAVNSPRFRFTSPFMLQPSETTRVVEHVQQPTAHTMASSPTSLRSVVPVALLLGCAAVHQILLNKQQEQQSAEGEDSERAQELASHRYRQATLTQVMAAAAKASPGELVLTTSEEWYTVSIAQVPMGYLHTTIAMEQEARTEGSRGPLVTTTELMDVQARPRTRPQPLGRRIQSLGPSPAPRAGSLSWWTCRWVALL